MRAETVGILREAMRQRIPAYVLVNNLTEGNAPLTIQALIDLLTCAVADDAPPPSCGPDPRGEPDSQAHLVSVRHDLYRHEHADPLPHHPSSIQGNKL